MVSNGEGVDTGRHAHVRDGGLNDDQRMTIESILTMYRREEQILLFVSGSAGTGKSYLLKKLVQRFELEHRRAVPVMACTAVAARIVDGVTVHSAMGMNFEGKISRLPDKFEEEKLFIFDEVSMMSAAMLDEVEAALRRRRCATDEAFGGASVIMFGDLYQLGPISTRMEPAHPVYEAMAWSKFHLFNLTVNMRQTETEFIDALNRLRVGDESCLAYFNRVHCTDQPIDDEDEYTVLTGKNEEVDTFNVRRLNRLVLCERNERHSLSTTVGGKRRACRQNLGYLLPRSVMNNVFAQTDVCVGARIMVTHNNRCFGVINGDVGKVTGFDVERGRVVAIYVTIVGAGPRQIYSTTLTFDDSSGGGGDDANEVTTVEVTGFTVRLAWASTVHKIQGATIDRLVVQPDKLFANGHLYVALSRVKNVGGLKIYGRLDKRHIRCDKAVTRLYEGGMPEWKCGGGEVAAH